jgi:uncharacterized protein YjbI with pentapeptide repeats
MVDKKCLDILENGIDVWNDWRKETKDTRLDLNDADLSGRILDGADFTLANLVRADLSNTSLENANFNRANLLRTKLNNAILIKANFTAAEFFGVNLSNADLSGASFNNAEIEHTNFERATLAESDFSYAFIFNSNFLAVDFSKVKAAWTVFAEMDLSVGTGLDKMSLNGPCTIGVDTLYKSKGKIPEIFLRHAGVPDNLITYLPSLIRKAIEFYSCFISHSSKDKRFCDLLYADLQASSIRAWYFPEDAKWGESVWGEIDKSIKLYDKLIVICSKNSLQSGPVLREIERALNREDREGKNILFPVRLDDYVFQGWSHERKDDVLRKIVGNFKGWNRSAAKYEDGFKKLIKALQTEVIEL